MSVPEASPTPDLGWGGERAARWLAEVAGRENQLLPVSAALFEHAQLTPGQHVLDVGCGTGPTTVEAAGLVSPGGSATGLDVSAAMLENARSRAGGERVRWLVGDATTAPFEPDSFDAVISRFGVMFFADPARAFTHLADVTRPDGVLCMAVWMLRDASPFFADPFAVVVDALSNAGATIDLPPLDAPPFGLGDPARTTVMLTASGWTDVVCHEDMRPLYTGGQGITVDQAVTSVIELGPVRAVLETQPDRLVEVATQALREDFAERHDGSGVAFPGGFMIVTARRA